MTLSVKHIACIKGFCFTVGIKRALNKTCLKSPTGVKTCALAKIT